MQTIDATISKYTLTSINIDCIEQFNLHSWSRVLHTDNECYSFLYVSFIPEDRSIQQKAEESGTDSYNEIQLSCSRIMKSPKLANLRWSLNDARLIYVMFSNQKASDAHSDRHCPCLFRLHEMAEL